MSTAISTVAKILKKVSSTEKLMDSSPADYKAVHKVSSSSLPEYKPMAKLQRESSLPRIEVDRPKPLVRNNSDPGRRARSSYPVQDFVLHNQNFVDNIGPQYNRGTGERGTEDRSQKLLTNTKKVRGLRSFLWIKPSSSSAQTAFLCQLVPCLLSNIGCFSTGLSIGYYTIFLSWSVQAEQIVSPWSNRTSAPVFPVPEHLGSWIGSVFWLGVLFGVLLASQLGPRLGQRVSLLLLTLPDLLGWVLLACPPSPPLLFFGRLLTGVASGGYLPTIRKFTGQLCQQHHLAQLSLLPLPVIAFGTLTFYILGLTMHPGHASAVCIAVPTIFAVSLLFLADSPAWLLSQGQDHLAMVALEKLRGGDTGTAISEFMVLQREAKNREPTPDLIEGLQTIYRKHMDSFATISIFVFVMIFSGKFTVDFFAIQLLQMAGSHGSEHLSAIIVALLQLVGSAILVAASGGNFSRKALYIFSSVISGAALAVFALSIYSFTTYSSSASALFPLLSLSLFMVSTPMGLTSLPLNLLHDAFPPELEPLTSTVTLVLAALHLLTASQLFVTLQSLVGLHTVVWAQAGLCFLASLLGLHLLPEQKKKEHDDSLWDKFAGLRRDRAMPCHI